MPEPVTVGIDVGGTKLVGGALDPSGRVLDRRRVPVPRDDAAALCDTIARLARELGPGLPIGIGIAGIVDRDGTLRYAPNLGMRDLPLRRWVADELGVPAVVGNDAAMALYGEWRAGAGQGVDDLVMLTVGTGVGGGLLLDGRLVDGVNGLGAELGHVIVQEGGRLCPCGNAGCLEAYASGTAIERRARQRLAGGGVPSRLRESGEPVDGRAVTTAAGEGDAFAIEVLREAGFWLGVGIAALVNALDPARVLVGGGAGVNAGETLVSAAREAATARIMGGAHRQPLDLRLAQLGDDAGMVGAGLLATAGGP